MSEVGIQRQPTETSGGSSAYTERGHERVAALEQHFEQKERRAQAQHSQQSNGATAGASVPLLLKPNGAPVFQNQDVSNGSLIQTMKRGASQGQANDLERTVKAHTFVVGKPTQNHTNITVLDVQKTSAAEDQHFPVKVLYVKPSMVKPSANRPRTAQTFEEAQKRAFVNKTRLAWQGKQNDDLEVSMGEVSGIFKEERAPKYDRVPVKQPKPRKGQSADQAAKEMRIQAQREYAKEVRLQAQIKAKEAEQLKKEKERTVKRKDQAAQEAEDQSAELALTVKQKSTGPHSGNRYQGQFQSMTADLFRKAQEKLLLEKVEEKRKTEEQKVKREKERQYLEEIKQRNIEILKQQRGAGHSLPPGGLKQREEKIKELKHRQELGEDNERRRGLRQKRFSESRAMLGLDQADSAKLARLAQKKEEEQALRDQERRAQQRIVRERARKAEAQREAARQQLNRDLIDFTDPNAAIGKKSAREPPQDLEGEDEEASEIIKSRRAAILAEQREKRRIKEQIKAEKEAEERARREDEMRHLQETLYQQRMSIAKKQMAAAEKQERLERMRKREAANGSQSGSVPKKKKGKDGAAGVGQIQLSELKDWIDQQVKLDEQKMAKFATAEAAAMGSQKSQSPLKQRTIEQTTLNADMEEEPKDPAHTGSKLPGNHLLPPEQERLVGVRQNRYGTLGDNGFDDIAALQAEKEGIDLAAMGGAKVENILNFQQLEGNQELDDQYDIQPVKQEKTQQRRVIVNRPQKEEEQSPAVKALPGVVNIQQEAAKQKAEEDKRRTWAAAAIQKRVRGWQDRKRVAALRKRMRREAEEDRSQFVQHYKMHDKYNINKFLKEKEKYRKMNKTDKIEESISENIAQSSGQVDAVIGSFDQSKQTNILQNLLGRTQQRATERDPNSLIALYARNKVPTEVVERERSRSGHKMEKRVQRQQKESKRLQMSGGIRRGGGGSSAKRKRSTYIDEDIEEDLPKSSTGKDDDQYSSDFQSEHISESLPSYLGSSKSKPKDAKSSSEIQESIQGSGTMHASSSKKEAKQPAPAKVMVSGTYDSIPEEVQSQSIVEDEIIDEVDDVAEKEDMEEQISEESYLKDSKQLEGSAVRRPSGAANDSANNRGKQQETTIPKKSERVREAIIQDFENDGAVPLAGSLKAQKMREMQEKLAKDQEQKYRTSRQIIDEFENNKAIGSEEHQRLIKGLAEELQRYEAAVSGSIFIEQFQSIVHKSLAQRDMMMLGQRLAQMEAEKKHQQEIADIRAEQLKMMSQLMILQAGAGSAATTEKQEQILLGIQKLVDKPVIIQRPEADVIEESHVSKKSKQEMQKSFGGPGLQQSMKYTSMTQSQIKDSQLNLGPERRSQIEDSGGIADEIGSVQPADDEEDSIIEESMNIEQSQSQQLSAARRYLGSEKAVQDTSKAVIDNKKRQDTSLFANSSFQNYTSKKFKDLLFNDGSQMDVFLDQIENAINKKSEQEKKELKKQLDANQISQKTFNQKQRDIERWVTAERREIGEKRAKVQDTYGEIGQFLKKLEQDKNLIMDKLSNQSTPRTGLRRSTSQLSVTNSLKDAHEQLRDIKEGRIGSVQPETKYLNKKREYVRQLIKEKRDAIDRGVKEKMRDVESDMIDEAMQMALQLDVDQEVEKRVGLLRAKIEEAKLDQSRKSNTMNNPESHMGIEESGKYSAIDQSKLSSTYNRVERMSQRSGGKKNVTFHSPTPKDSSSYHSGSKREADKSLRSESIAEDIDNDVGTSININESVQQSSASASKPLRSQQVDQSLNKVSESNKISEQIPEQYNEDDSINSRVQSEMDGSYTSDFASGSYAPEKSRSAKHIKPELEDSEQYSAKFDEASASQSRKTGKGDIAVDQVDEDSGDRESQSRQSEEQQQAKRDSIKSKKSQQRKKAIEKQQRPSMSDLTDREIFESTMSVDWQVTLQQKLASSYASEQDEPAPAEEESEPTEEQIDSSIQEEESERTQEAGKGLEDLDSYPSASLSKSNEHEFQMRVDNITEELLNQILEDFQADENVRLEVEDNYEEEQFEDKWPFSEAKKPQQEEKPLSPVAAAPPKQDGDGKKTDEQEKESEAMRQHDEAMKKYHEEQAALEAQHKKVVEYLDFMIQIVDKEVLMQALAKPIQHDPLRVLEKIQAFDGEDEVDQYSKQNISTYSQVFEPYLFDEIDRQWEELHQNKSDAGSQLSNVDKNIESDKGWTSKELRNVHHMAIFDAFNEALDLERPYKTKGQPNPWSKQTRLTTDSLTPEQVDQIINRARSRVIEWDKTGAGTKFAPPPPPPPAQGDYDTPPHVPLNQESEEERTGAERRERLGLLLTKEVHQKETDWLDYEYEDTQVRFDLADMILEELADEVTQFLVENAEGRGQFMDYNL